MRSVVVCGLGLGYSLALLLADKGYAVTGIDINPKAWLNPRLDETMKPYESMATKIDFTENYDAVSDAELAFVFVSTPFDHATKRLDASNVENAVGNILKRNRTATIVILSTMPIGGTDELISKFPEAKGRILLAPPQVRQGFFYPTFHKPPLQLIGDEYGLADHLLSIYANLQHPATNYLYADFRTVETTKLIINAFLASKVVFSNAVADYCSKLGLDGTEVMKLATHDPRVGATVEGYRTYTMPGDAYGWAPCLGRDIDELLSATAENSRLHDWLQTVKRLNLPACCGD